LSYVSAGSCVTSNFRLSVRRGVEAAKAFFAKVMKPQGHAPETITLDGYATSRGLLMNLFFSYLIDVNTAVLPEHDSAPKHLCAKGPDISERVETY
jgi:hypothetical protein